MSESSAILIVSATPVAFITPTAFAIPIVFIAPLVSVVLLVSSTPPAVFAILVVVAIIFAILADLGIIKTNHFISLARYHFYFLSFNSIHFNLLY